MHKPFNFIKIFLGAAGMLSLSLNPLFVNAAEWSAQPSVRLTEGYDNNARLTLNPHNSVSSSLLAPKLNLVARSDLWQWSGNAEAVQNRFSGDSDLDTDERFFNIGAAYQSERSTWQLTGSSSKSSVLTDRQINSTTGFVQTQSIQDAHSISPSWTWSMNELTQLQLDYSLSNASYVNGISIGLYDYSTRSISASLTRLLDSQNKLFFSAGYSIFNVPATSLNSKSATYQAGSTWIFSETSRGTVSAGLRMTTAEQDEFQFVPRFCLTCPPSFLEFVPVPVTIRSESTGIVFNGSFEKQFENNSFKISASRSLNPGGTGGQVQNDSLGLALNRAFTSKFSGGLSLNSNTARTEIGNVSVSDYRLYQIGSNLSWQWTPEWNLDTSYRYAHLRRTSEANPVASNAVYLALRYQWQKMAISR
jgi:hypothetical protein